MSGVIPTDIRKEAHRRVSAVLRCLAVLVPDATPRQRKRLANKILTLADGKDRMQCLQRNCPELVFWEPIARSLNLFFNEED